MKNPNYLGWHFLTVLLVINVTEIVLDFRFEIFDCKIQTEVFPLKNIVGSPNSSLSYSNRYCPSIIAVYLIEFVRTPPKIFYLTSRCVLYSVPSKKVSNKKGPETIFGSAFSEPDPWIRIPEPDTERPNCLLPQKTKIFPILNSGWLDFFWI